MTHHYVASYYTPRPCDPPGVYCAVRGHRGQVAVLRLSDGRTVKLRVRDYCPLPSRCDIVRPEFRRLFGREGMRRGVEPVSVRFEGRGKR